MDTTEQPKGQDKTALRLFNYQGFQFRATEAVAGKEHVFVAKDVCRILDIENASKAAERLDEDEKSTLVVETAGGPQQMVVVTLAGLYRLIFTSRKEGARDFQRWVFHEVLPALLQGPGTYSVPGRPRGKPPTLPALLRSYDKGLVSRDEVRASIGLPPAPPDLVAPQPLPVHRAAKPLGPAIHPQVARFLASCCEPDDESRVECGALHDAYLAWCAENDVPLCEHTFWRSVAAAGFGPYKTHGVRYRTGLRLVEVK